MMNGLCEGMVCVKGCNTENDIQTIPSHKPSNNTSIYHSLYYILSVCEGM